MSIEYLLPRPDGELVVAAVSDVVGSVQAEVDTPRERSSCN